MRGFFGLGAERISKPMNLGAILRTAHAFEASFVFSIDADHRVREIERSDTAKTSDHVPYWSFDGLDEVRLPKGCVLVGVELTENAAVLPTFHHPPAAAYLLGPEKGSLSPEAQARCAHLVQIPTRFCVNVSVAAAIICYDRMLTHGGFPDRPGLPGGLTNLEIAAHRAARKRPI